MPRNEFGSAGMLAWICSATSSIAHENIASQNIAPIKHSGQRRCLWMCFTSHHHKVLLNIASTMNSGTERIFSTNEPCLMACDKCPIAPKTEASYLWMYILLLVYFAELFSMPFRRSSVFEMSLIVTINVTCSIRWKNSS